ncbi:Thiol-disulfide oxidoreductase YkuV [Aquisphaera giovannonii]|uniref:Thiol-disulfide oxidoreductase YkuV n=1 Tax=Aquisphaera giovannonii TaxID=406548 RepID=A0A5B9W9Y5_9BACT|nr:thioredoxin-like domain-containing protein [Aquisphaera giovannonii]QEH37247.1 Thiol-disulfide oxidoreductase YkuV [Aquisphaera giovannonii]
MPRHQTRRRRPAAMAALILGIALVGIALRGPSGPRRPAEGPGRPPGATRLVSLHQDEAPSLEGGVGWINSGPIRLSDLKGKVVLLDFWTYCCINCHHVLPTLARIEEKYKDEVVVIGVHSGKFDAERDVENIRRKVAEYRIKHPVVNDAEMTIWERFGVSSWPTLVLITPDGKIGGSNSGEIAFDDLDRAVGQVIARHKDRIDRKAMSFAPEMDRVPAGPLLFPGKVHADAAGGSLFISDTGHNRIVRTDLEGKDATVIGSGEEGLKDGGFDEARFNRPQGTFRSGDVLYVADTENHAIRAVDLKRKKVATISGDGKQAPRSPLERYEGIASKSQLSSPWDIAQVPGSPFLYIAMAGPHQIWRLDPAADRIGVWAGSGYENIQDGDLEDARFAQPSGLATDGDRLFVADSEVSGIRFISGVKSGSPRVGRIVGEGLFQFGDVDGIGPKARLQHCLGIAFAGGKLYIADTYNNKIKGCDLKTRVVKTFAGDGKPGSTDSSPRFYQPGGLAVAGNRLYVADTNNHKVRVIDIPTRSVRTLEVDVPSPRAMSKPAG